MTNIILLFASTIAALAIGLAFWIQRQLQAASSVSLHTGLRAIDVFLPLPTGGDVLLTGDHRSGIPTLANELAWRFLHDSRFRHDVVYVLDSALADLEERITEISEQLPMLTSPIVTATVSKLDLQDEIDRCANNNLVIIVATENPAFQQSARDAVRWLKGQIDDRRKLTFIAVTEESTFNGFDAVISCSSLIGQEGVYPAIDLCKSYSTLTRPILNQKQQAAILDVASMIRQLTRDVTVGAVRDPNWIYNCEHKQRPVLQAFCFLSQAYFTAEPFTGKRAARVSVKTAVAEFTTILSESLMDVGPTSFLYQNSIPASPRKFAISRFIKTNGQSHNGATT